MIHTSFLRHLLVFLGIFLVHLAVFILIKDHGLMMDEHYHYAQIQRFLHGDYRLDPELPMSPGYHALVAGFSRSIGIDLIPYYLAVPYIRGVSWGFSLMTIVFFFLCARLVDRSHALVKTVQYSVFPIFLPFFPLLYTDLATLAIVLCSFWLLLSRKWVLSGLVASASILLRQNTIVWCAGFATMAYVMQHGYGLRWRHLKQYVQNSVGFLVAPVVFFFLIWKFGGVSSGGQTYVSPTVVIPKNLFLLLFLYFFFFLPVILAQAKKSISFLRTLRWWYFILLAGAYIPFHLTFFIEHPYNYGSFFIHNAIMEYFTANWIRSLSFFVIMTVSLVSIAVTRLMQPAYYLLYPWTVLFFLPLWFIEQRYTMIPFALYILLRRHEGKWTEYGFILWNGIFSAAIYWGMHQWKLFW